MNQKSTLKAWRDVVGLVFTVGVSAREEMRSCWALTQLQQLLTGYFDIATWYDFRDLLRDLTEDVTWNPRREARHSSGWRENSLWPRIFDMGRRWSIVQNDDAWAFTIVPGVRATATRSQGPRGSEFGIDLALHFDDPKIGSEIHDAFRTMRDVDRNLDARVSEWDAALYVQGATREDWVFTRDSRERLGGRITQVNAIYANCPVYRIAPLEGEQLVVYGDRAVTADLGLQVEYSRSMVRHPDENVVASVGPFSLSLKRDDSRGGRPRGRSGSSWDKLAVFHDRSLPIQAPDAVEGDDYYGPTDDGIGPWDPDGWHSDEY